MPGPYVDCHAHLHGPEYAGDRAAVLDRAARAGVCAVLTSGTEVASSGEAVELAQAQPVVFATVGVHPHAAEEATPEALEAIEQLVVSGRVVAIGEIGLDYHYENSPRARQREAFAAQLELARRVRLPIVIYDREAHEDILAVLHEQGSEWHGIVHCFSGDIETAKEFLALGLAVSLGGPVTFKNGRLAREVAAAVPLDRLVLETDCPYLAPDPWRGRRNEPAGVARVAEVVAGLRGLKPEELGLQTTLNAIRIFGLPEELATG